MANIVRSYTVASIWQGPLDVYVNITAPASSATPNADTHCLTLDANGQPTSNTGFHIGSVEGPTTIQITEKCNEILDDQHESPIGVAFDNITAEIDFTMKETSLTRLQTFLTSGGLGVYTALGNSQVLQIGGQFDSSTSMITLLLVGPSRSAAGKFAYCLVYKTYLKSAIAMAFQRSKETLYKLKAGCIMDTSRVSGDELMAICRTK